ncbi:MAG: CPCC family cysteine-rich protein [Sulfuricaulis sp.]
MMDRQKYPCPCCGYRVFQRQPGNHEKCPICLWEDDLAQLRFPRMPGSANHVSLEQGQHNFADFGAAERRRRGEGRTPFAEESREDSWRPLDPARDNIEEPQHGIDYADTYPFADTTVLYYWRETYWRRFSS